jgi:hypothetical protein
MTLLLSVSALASVKAVSADDRMARRSSETPGHVETRVYISEPDGSLSLSFQSLILLFTSGENES